MSNSSHWRREVGKWALLSVGIVAVILIFQFGVRGWPSLPVVFRSIALGFLVCVSVSGLAFTIMPRVAQRIWHYPVAFRWTGLVVAMMACGAAGLSLGIAVFSLTGILPAKLIPTVFRENILGVTITTIIIGSVFTIFGSTKARLEATELELQTQRLERERAQKLAAEAKLASLSSRVQPHFLFNTLNAISALVREDPPQAERTIERLSSLLRSSLDGKKQVPLEQELKLVADYLEIQRTRLGQRLHFSISAEPQATGMVPPFAVQTLVENSVRHAGEQRPEGVELKVVAHRTGPDLMVDVIDNGPGFDLDAVRVGHGLDTLMGRLRELHGKAAAVEFERAPGAMIARLRVPAA